MVDDIVGTRNLFDEEEHKVERVPTYTTNQLIQEAEEALLEE